ncbi:Sodium/hydrogen exchanger 10 [Apodemus speciosus]|uniref:Sodium/hydrogen exchanger 10 n=1 Tax=Apodemus speciosus TaxID=105296 RepID=A0ABQ0EFF3_APOSI
MCHYCFGRWFPSNEEEGDPDTAYMTTPTLIKLPEGFSRMVLKNSEVFVLMILSLSGFVTGRLAYHFVEVHQIVYPLLKTPSFSLYCYFLPLIVFVAALDVDFYIVKNVFWQVLLTGLISFGTAFAIISYVVLKLNGDSWDLQCCMLFSITLCVIDPLHSVNTLKTIGISKMYTDIIRGESLIICSFTCIFFGIFRGHTTNASMFRDFRQCKLHIIIGLSFDIFGSTVCGYWCTRVIQIILTDLFSNTLTNVVLCFSLGSGRSVEYFGMSGIVALVTVGLNLDSLSFKPRMEFIITKLLTIILVSPILMHSSYEYDWRWGCVIAWSGIRGVFSLLLAPDIYNISRFKLAAPHMVYILYTSTIIIDNRNKFAYDASVSRYIRSLCALSLPRQMAVRNAIEHIQEIIRNTITLFKTEKILTNVNWDVVEEKAKIEYNSILKQTHIQSSFEKQCNDGILGVEAARILIGATKSYCPIHGKFMSISDPAPSSTINVRRQGGSLQFRLSFLPRRSVGRVGIVFTDKDLEHLFLLALILILKRKYFLQNWNTLDFFIIVMGIIDILCLYFVKLRPDSLVLIQFTVVIGYLRVIRFLPIFKIIIPILINLADVQIKKSLSLMYSITKGYKLYDILERNKREAIRELGLIEHEGRDVVIALKTKQTIRNVIAKALKNLTFLWSRGIIDKHEGIEMNKVLLTKIKALNNFPMAIPPPTPDKYLPNIVWMENKDVLIEFFKLHSSSPTFGIDSSQRTDRQYKTMYTEYCTSGDVLGELSCLLKREVEYTAICETTLQAFFISLEDLYEGFDVFWPSLEYKMWLKLALSIANQYFEASIAGEDLKFQKCVMFNHAYVETLSSYNEMTLNHVTMKHIILVYGNVINSKTEETHIAPSIIPKSCEQIQGIADVSKLLIIPTSEPVKNDATSHAMVNAGLRTTKRDYNWKRKDELLELMWGRLSSTGSQAYICDGKGLVTLGQNRIESQMVGLSACRQLAGWNQVWFSTPPLGVHNLLLLQFQGIQRLKVDTPLERHINETVLECGISLNVLKLGKCSAVLVTESKVWEESAFLTLHSPV